MPTYGALKGAAQALFHRGNVQETLKRLLAFISYVEINLANFL